MFFKEAIDTVKGVISCNDVPLLVGEAGIGKTALMRKVAEDNNMLLFTIDCTLLKEGEIGGLPYVSTSVNNKALKNKVYKLFCDPDIDAKKATMQVIKGIEENEAGTKELRYAPFHVLKEILSVSETNPNQKILLFLDELNRCEHSVHQELMNIILQRNINGLRIPSNVYITAAMNPSSKLENFQNSNYQVVDLDPAQASRMTWLEMESDIKEWIEWGVKDHDFIFEIVGQEKPLEFTDSIIHTDIMEYLSTYPENLNITEETTEDISPNPRSWERVSKAYYLYKYGYMERNVLFNIIKGNIGMHVGLEFFSFVEEKKNPLPTAEEVFSDKNLLKEEDGEMSEYLENIIDSEPPARLLVLNSRLCKYLEKSKMKKEEYWTYIKLIHAFPADLINTIYHDIYNRKTIAENGAERQSKLFNNLCKFSTFVSGYNALDAKIIELANLKEDEV